MKEHFKIKSLYLKRVIAALLVAMMVINIDGIQGIGKLTAYAEYDFPSRMSRGEPLSVPDSAVNSILVVFCSTDADASNALAAAVDGASYGSPAEYGTALDASRGNSISAPQSDGTDDTVLYWDLYGKRDGVIFHGAATGYDVAVYISAKIDSDPPVPDKPTYNIYCEYGDDAAEIKSGFFSGNDNFLRNYGNRVNVGESGPSAIGSPSYDVDSWTLVGEETSESCNIAVYKAVYEGGILCEADNGTNTVMPFSTTFSMDNSSSKGTLELPTASEAGFGYPGHKLAGWSTEESETVEYLPGASFDIDRGNPRRIHAVWAEKTAVTLVVTVDSYVYEGDSVRSKIAVTKEPSEAPGTPELEYKGKDEADTAYSETEPSSPGEYTVRAHIDESDEYAAAEDITDFEILSSSATVSVTYNPNGGVGTQVSDSVNVSLEEGESSERTGSITLLSAEDAGFSRVGYKLAGWKERNDPSGTVRLPGSSYTGITADTSTLEFSAVWEEKADASVTVSVDAPVYAGTEASILSKINVVVTPGDAEVRLSFKAADATTFTSTVPTTEGSYTVKAQVDETDDYKDAFSVANFEILPADVDVSVTYNPNGGTGSAVTENENVDLTSGDGSVTLLGADDAGFTRANYKLVGWRDSTGAVYDPGDEYTGITATTTSLEFDAVWELKTAGRISVSVNTPCYEGDNITITVTANNSNGDVTYKYKKKAAAESAYTTTPPTLPGVYTVLAILEETDDYSSAETTEDFEILSRRISISMTYKPNGGSGDVITQSDLVSLDDGRAEIKLLSSADFKKSGYILTGWKDQNGKTYSLGATYAVSSDNRSPEFDAVWTAKKAGSVDIDIKTPAYVGAKIKYDVDKNSDGDVKVEYKKKGEKDEKYSKDVPTEAGEYTVRATLEETDEYSAAEDTDDFKIVYLDAPDKPYTYQEVTNSKGTVTDLTIVPATGYSISTSATASGLSSIRYSTAKQAGGVCLIRDEDKATTDMIKLADYTASDAPSISVEKKFYYGVAVSATGSSLTPATLTIEYKRTDAADSAYSRTAPTEPGKYTVRLSAPASGFYAAVNETAYFSIEYLDAPSTKAGLQGIKGKGDWYTSDVTIVAPTGYLISTKLGEGYTSSISWHDGITKLYYMRTSDGAMTDAVEANFDVKIDKKEPKMDFDSSMELGLPRDGMTIYSNSITFTISDDNLKSVTVKGKTYTFSNGKCVVMLDAGLTTEPVEIIAKDEAGNEYTILIELCPAWMQDNVMPLGRDVLLTSGTEYSFAPGTRIMMNGDATVYEGGSKFYVRTTRTCNFSTK